MTIQAKTADNGVNVAALLGAREALSEAPEAHASSGARPANG